MSQSVPTSTTTASGDAAWRPWAIGAIGAAFFFLSIFVRVSPSAMVGELMRDFAVGAAVLGNISAFYFYAYAGMQIPVGITLDRFGPRRMMTLAATMAAIGCLVFALAPNAMVASLGRTLTGTGCAFAWIGSVTMISIWFPPAKFAQVMGLASMSGMLGGVIGQSPVAVAVEAVGWRATQVGAAALAGTIALVMWLIVRDRRSGAPVQTATRFSSKAAFKIVRTPQTWIAGVVIAAEGTILMAFVGLWSVPFLTVAYGFQRTAAAGAASMFLLGWAVGAPIIGWISDRLARRQLPALVGGIASFACVLAVIYVPGMPSWSVFPLMFLGGFSGCSSIIAFAVIREINRPGDVATAMSIANLLPMAISAALQPFIGWLLDLQWTGAWLDGAKIYDAGAFRLAFLTLVLSGVGAVVSCLLLQETGARSSVVD